VDLQTPYVTKVGLKHTLANQLKHLSIENLYS